MVEILRVTVVDLEAARRPDSARPERGGRDDASEAGGPEVSPSHKPSFRRPTRPHAPLLAEHSTTAQENQFLGRIDELTRADQTYIFSLTAVVIHPQNSPLRRYTHYRFAQNAPTPVAHERGELKRLLFEDHYLWTHLV